MKCLFKRGGPSGREKGKALNNITDASFNIALKIGFGREQDVIDEAIKWRDQEMEKADALGIDVGEQTRAAAKGRTAAEAALGR